MLQDSQLNLNLPEDSSVKTVEEYRFDDEPIKGYPTLNWKGKRPFTNTRYYPAQLKERHGEPVEGWLNKIFWGDNIQVMSHLLKEYRGKVNLVYIDPPFDSKADYKKKISLKGQQVTNDQNTFEEKQYTDIWTNDEYLQFMFERLILIRELLSDDGSIYLHCDWHKSHYLRCLLEQIFGGANFRNEIIWCYTGPSQSSSNFPRKHDNILRYSKTSNLIFNKNSIRIPYIAQFTEARGLYGTKYENVEQLQTVHERGKVPEDWWSDMSNVSSYRNELIGYPTQKPEALLERIIKASSNEGDLVFDCFMGSGTTQAVAMKLGRRFIGADINLGAVQITTKRLLGIANDLNQSSEQQSLDVSEDESTTYYTGFEVYNVNHYDVFRNPVQAKELLIEALEIHRLEQSNLFDGEKDGRMWKIMPVNRIATRSDLNELIAGFDYKAFEKRKAESPNKPVEHITLVCMGHEPDLEAQLKKEVPYELDVKVVDILRDRQDLQFKRDSEAKIIAQGKHLVIEKFYPMNLLAKLSLEKEKVDDWRELVESIMIDWNYDGAVLEPALTDIPGKDELVSGKYEIPEDAGTIRVKITDLLSESLEQEVQYA